MPEAAAAEVHANPDRVRLVDEDIDVVIAAADGAELRPRLAAQPLARMPRQRVPRRAPEQRMIDGSIVGAVLPANAEGDDVLDLVGDLRQPIDEAGRAVQRQVGANRGVAAGDVETDADHRHLPGVGRHAADRHDVAQVPVGHQRRAFGAAGDVVELRQRVRFVVAEDGDVGGYLVVLISTPVACL